MLKLKNKNILVYGLSRTGQALLDFLKNKKCKVFAYDDIFSSSDSQIIGESYEIINKYNATYFDENKIDLKKIDMIIFSPGVPLNSELLIKAKLHKILIMGEIEFAYHFCKSKNIIAITGTNGKTTTTTLVHHIIKSERICYIGGNVGIPFISFAEKVNKSDVVVLELSSFQLESVIKFRPKISCILNLHPDHLNRYKNVLQYYKSKLNIARNQKRNDVCVLNFDDINFKEINFESKAKKLWFSLENGNADAFTYYKAFLVKNNNKLNTANVVVKFEDVHLVGNHNYLNILASILICEQIGISNENIFESLKTFKPIEHRLEFVKNIDGVQYYNDSKATNIDATLNALTAFKKDKVHLILGGSDKGEDFTELFKNLNENIYCYFCGEVNQKLTRIATDIGYHNYTTHNRLIDALNSAKENACAGDVILLSPACASFDEFRNYEERGKYFKSWVNNEN